MVVGVTDRLSFGSGNEVMPYLIEGSEASLSWNLGLTEAGNMGHIVLGYKDLLDLVYHITILLCFTPIQAKLVTP